jgi:hypothetical protein
VNASNFGLATNESKQKTKSVEDMKHFNDNELKETNNNHEKINHNNKEE